MDPGRENGFNRPPQVLPRRPLPGLPAVPAPGPPAPTAARRNRRRYPQSVDPLLNDEQHVG